MNEREKFLRWVPSESNPCTISERTRVLFFFIIRKIEFFIYIYKNKYFLYAHRDLSVYIARIWESIYIYNSKVSLRWLKVYRWAESSAKIFKNYFFKSKLFFIEMNEREKFLRWVPSESNPCTNAERTRVLFFLKLEK